ncbi:MAG TPA: dienelactone hydrolase family protein [Chroococcales cyanobacterium]
MPYNERSMNTPCMQAYIQSIEAIHLDCQIGKLTGDLNIPPNARGIVLFAHGSGSSRMSPRNQFVAAKLNEAGFATLLLDLLTPEEEAVDEKVCHLRFNIPMLAGRLGLAVNWIKANTRLAGLPIGLFGASTGSAAAIICAAENRRHISAVVSRGGRPDLAGRYLTSLRAPILLIVGGADAPVIELNEAAMEKMRCEHKILRIPGATHLFQEPNALERVAHLATQWLLLRLTNAPADATAGSSYTAEAESENQYRNL